MNKLTDTESLNNEKIRRKEYTERIIKAVNYKGNDDFEDVPSILHEYQEENLNIIDNQKAEIDKYKKVVGELVISEDGEAAIFLDSNRTEYIRKSIHSIFIKMARRQAITEAIKELVYNLKEKYKDYDDNVGTIYKSTLLLDVDVIANKIIAEYIDENIKIPTHNEVCNDNRFELIEKYKKELFEHTNIYTNDDEIKVLDSILFRCWQMGWLDKLENYDSCHNESESLQERSIMLRGLADTQKTEIERLQNIIVGFMDEVGTWSNKHDIDVSTIYKLPLIVKEDNNVRDTIKANIIKELREKCNQYQEFITTDSGQFKGCIDMEDLDRIIDEM